MHKKIISMLIALALSNSAMAFEYSKQDDSYIETLSNGMKVVFKLDTRSNATIMQTWYKVGATDEIQGKTGLAHVLEHMMFKQTKNLKSGEFSEILTKHGANDNAFTSADFTVYHEEFDISKLDLMMALEAERMQNLTLDPEELNKELEVIKEERRMRLEDNPNSILHEKFMLTAIETHPYRNMVIGQKSDLDGITPTDVKSFHSKYYMPNNAWVVIVGNKKPEDVFNTAKKYFSNIKKQADITRTYIAKEPQGEAYKQIEVETNKIKTPLIQLGWKVPSISGNFKEACILEVLQAVLDSHEYSPISKNLIKNDHIFKDGGISYDNIKRGDIAIFEFNGTMLENTDVKQASLQVVNVIKSKAMNVSEKELSDAKKIITNRKSFERDSLYGYGLKLGQQIGLGTDTGFWAKFDDTMMTVTTAEIAQVAEKYLTPTNLTVGIAYPAK